MVKQLCVLLLCGYFLLGKTLLPQGDFSLMADLPQMYRQYKAIEPPEEVSVFDFVVDYLLNGEEFEKQDAGEKPIPFASVQFQHEANPLSFILTYCFLPAVNIQPFFTKHFIKNDVLHLPIHRTKLFRPPLLG